MNQYPGIRDSVERWLTFVEYLPDARPEDGNVQGFGRMLESMTEQLFDREPIVLLLATLADEKTEVTEC